MTNHDRVTGQPATAYTPPEDVIDLSSIVHEGHMPGTCSAACPGWAHLPESERARQQSASQQVRSVLNEILPPMPDPVVRVGDILNVPGLVCPDCDVRLCDLEEGDTLSVLLGVASEHRCPADRTLNEQRW